MSPAPAPPNLQGDGDELRDMLAFRPANMPEDGALLPCPDLLLRFLSHVVKRRLSSTNACTGARGGQCSTDL